MDETYRRSDDREGNVEDDGRTSYDNAAALGYLAERLLSSPDPSGGQTDGPPRLYPGRLPDGLPLELPMPDGSTLVGGSTQSMGRGRWMNVIVLDAKQTAERFREDYRRQLVAAGWREDEDWPGPVRRGFVPPGLPGLFVRAAHRSPWLNRRLRGRVPGLPSIFPDRLRLGNDGPSLMVTAADRGDAPTDVRLRIIYGQRRFHVHDDPVWKTIPSLVPPPGTRGRQDDGHTGLLHPPRDARRIFGGEGGSWEPDGAYSTTILQTDLDLNAVGGHYTTRLQEAGWRLVERGEDGRQGWSTWRFTDERGGSWGGTFSVLRLSGPSTRYLLQIHAGRTESQHAE